MKFDREAELGQGQVEYLDAHTRRKSEETVNGIYGIRVTRLYPGEVGWNTGQRSLRLDQRCYTRIDPKNPFDKRIYDLTLTGVDRS